MLLWFYYVLKYGLTAFLNLLIRATQCLVFLNGLIFDLVFEESIPRVFHSHDGATEKLFDLIQKVQIVE